MSAIRSGKEPPGDRIRCSVNTCHFYMPGNRCGADFIEVGPPNASSREETGCDTFVPAQLQDRPPQYY